MSLENTVQLLSQLTFFRVFDRDSLRLVAFSARPKKLRAGDVLFRAGDKASGAYLIEEGRIGLWLSPKSEPEQVCETGVLLGEMSLIAENDRPCSAIALEDSVLLGLDRSTMRRVFTEAPHIARAMESRLQKEMGDFMSSLNAIESRLG